MEKNENQNYLLSKVKKKYVLLLVFQFSFERNGSEFRTLVLNHPPNQTSDLTNELEDGIDNRSDLFSLPRVLNSFGHTRNVS